jgi:hypothetical protein
MTGHREETAMTAWIWLLAVFGGAAALGACIFYGQFYGQEKSEEPQSSGARQRREAATRGPYKDADAAD